MGVGAIVIGVIILVAVISGVAQVLKGQKESEPSLPKARARAKTTSAANRSSSGDIDRFLQEIDKLRKKSAEPVAVKPKARAAEPARKARRIEVAVPVVPVVVPVAKSVPLAMPVFAEAPPAPESPILGGQRPTGPNDFAKALKALLGSQQSVPMAVVLQEVLGPPMSRRPTR